MTVRLAMVRHNALPPTYYPKCCILYDLTLHRLYEYSAITDSYEYICQLDIADLSRVFAEYAIERAVLCVDFTNIWKIAGLQSDLPIIACIGDTHHGNNPISIVRAALIRLNIVAIILLFTPCHARLFNDLASIYYIEGLCPTLSKILAVRDLAVNRKSSARTSDFILSGSLGSAHSRRRAIYESLLSENNFLGFRSVYARGDIDFLSNIYESGALCVNVPLSLDVNQKHWEILASYGIPLYLPSIEIPLHRILPHLSIYIPPSDCNTLRKKLSWAIGEREQLAKNAAKSYVYLTELSATGINAVSAIIEGRSVTTLGPYILHWPRQCDTRVDLLLKNRIISLVEEFQTVLDPMNLVDYDKMCKYLSDVDMTTASAAF